MSSGAPDKVWLKDHGPNESGYLEVTDSEELAWSKEPEYIHRAKVVDKLVAGLLVANRTHMELIVTSVGDGDVLSEAIELAKQLKGADDE